MGHGLQSQLCPNSPRGPLWTSVLTLGSSLFPQLCTEAPGTEGLLWSPARSTVGPQGECPLLPSEPGRRRVQTPTVTPKVRRQLIRRCSHRLLECSLPVRSEPSTKGRVCGVQKRDKEGGVLSNQPLSSRYLDTGKTRSPTFPLFLQMWGKSRSHNACSQMGKLRPDKENPTQVTQQVTPDQLPFASTSPSPDLTLKRKERSFPDPCRQVWV